MSTFFRPFAFLLAALILVLPSGFAVAQPPSPGSMHTFVDPVFKDTVFCDTIDQVRDIAISEMPHVIFAMYRTTRNAVHEPICIAIRARAKVVGVTPLCVMAYGKDHYKAWAVEVDVKGITAYALYLEPVEYV